MGCLVRAGRAIKMVIRGYHFNCPPFSSPVLVAVLYGMLEQSCLRPMDRLYGIFMQGSIGVSNALCRQRQGFSGTCRDGLQYPCYFRIKIPFGILEEAKI